MKITGGKFYKGDNEVAEPKEGPELWICRREEDYPANTIPREAGFDTCGMCQAVIVYNRKRNVHADRGPGFTHYDGDGCVPKVCMQCAGITPDPIPAGWSPYS